MGEKTGIAWTDASWNPWWGCAKVSPGCDNCYAERDSKRFYPKASLWGVDAERRFFGEAHWLQPITWNRKAIKDGRRLRVFCASMADVFDNHEDLPPVREMLWDLIRRTPQLDWLILTKRIGNAKSMLPPDWGDGYPNVWLGASIVNQAEADRDIKKLLNDVPARIHFLSCEPLLGPIDLGPFNCLNWVIVGGESGIKARPMDHEWARRIRDNCARHGVAFFMKQLSQCDGPDFKDINSFPDDLKVREYPT